MHDCPTSRAGVLAASLILHLSPSSRRARLPIRSLVRIPYAIFQHAANAGAACRTCRRARCCAHSLGFGHRMPSSLNNCCNLAPHLALTHFRSRPSEKGPRPSKAWPPLVAGRSHFGFFEFVRTLHAEAVCTSPLMLGKFILPAQAVTTNATSRSTAIPNPSAQDPTPKSQTRPRLSRRS